jgi:hypothetical protein
MHKAPGSILSTQKKRERVPFVIIEFSLGMEPRVSYRRGKFFTSELHLDPHHSIFDPKFY